MFGCSSRMVRDTSIASHAWHCTLSECLKVRLRPTSAGWSRPVQFGGHKEEDQPAGTTVVVSMGWLLQDEIDRKAIALTESVVVQQDSNKSPQEKCCVHVTVVRKQFTPGVLVADIFPDGCGRVSFVHVHQKNLARTHGTQAHMQFARTHARSRANRDTHTRTDTQVQTDRHTDSQARKSMYKNNASAIVCSNCIHALPHAPADLLTRPVLPPTFPCYTFPFFICTEHANIFPYTAYEVHRFRRPYYHTQPY